MRPRLEASFYLCDFDGTVARRDVGNRFFRAFTHDAGAWNALIDEWRAGRLGGREVLARECELAHVDEARARAFGRDEDIDPGFAAFVGAARARGDGVAIASDGLEFYIRAILEAHGLGHVPATANRVRFEGARLVPEFASREGEGCGRCGNCKGAVLERLASGYARAVFVGDGLSDRCGARAAHAVYAKGELFDWCRAEGIPARTFATFADVARAEGLDEFVAGRDMRVSGESRT